MPWIVGGSHAVLPVGSVCDDWQALNASNEAHNTMILAFIEPRSHTSMAYGQVHHADSVTAK